jgi:Ca2+-binding EF-hand superfamily protein
MFPLLGAAGGALSLLNSLLQSTSAATKTGGNLPSSLGQTLAGGADQQPQVVLGSGQGAPSLSNGTLATLISLQGQDGANQKGGLFGRIDKDGDGKISKSEFESTLGQAGVDTSSADALFSKLDADQDGSISKAELAPARRDHHSKSARQNGLSALLNSTDFTGASTKTASNSDGTNTTTITYADGSTVSMTTSAASGGTSGKTGGTHQANLLEQLIKMQSQLTAQKSTGAATSAIA